MDRDVFEDNMMKNSRIILCPRCDIEFRLGLNDIDDVCEECEKHLELEKESIEDFIWHPERKF